MNRRDFTIGASALLSGLPAFSQDRLVTAGNKRLLIVCNHLGLYLPDLTPKTYGQNFTPSPYLEVFKGFESKMTLLSNMTYHGEGGLHKPPITVLTGTSNVRPSKYQPSIDQVLAARLQGDATYPSLAFRATDGWGITSSYSWGKNGKPTPVIGSCYDIYDKLFKRYSNAEKLEQLNVLDSMNASLSRLRKTMTSADRERLDLYEHAIHGVEEDLQRRTRIKITHPFERELITNLDEPRMGLVALEVQLEMAYFSMLNNISNVAVVGFSSGPNFTLMEDGKVTGSTNGTYHTLSHHGDDEIFINELRKIDRHQLNSVARIIRKLDATPEGDGTMLDNTVVAFFAGYGHGGTHNANNRPVLLFGGNLSHKGHFDCKGANSANLYPTLCHAMGQPVDSFSISDGNFNELLS